MPSSATITAFYNFTANTKARASQVQNNFDVFRGHLLPVHVSTSTSANNTYDLGSNDYRWKDAYVANQINLGNLSTTAYLNESKLNFGATTTNAVSIEKDTATTTGEAIVKSNGVESFRVNSIGHSGYLNSTSFTTSAQKYGFAISATLNAALQTTSGTPIIGSTITLSCAIGRPIYIGFMDGYITASRNVGSTTTAAAGSSLSLMVDGSTLTTANGSYFLLFASSATNMTIFTLTFPLSNYGSYFFSNTTTITIHTNYTNVGSSAVTGRVIAFQL